MIPGPLEVNALNRPYHSKMRDLYFKRAGKYLERFRKGLQDHFGNPPVADLAQTCTHLQTAVEFAGQVIHRHRSAAPASGRGSPLGRPARGTRAGGPAILQEEVLFYYILQELHSSSVFLSSRMDTFREIGNYRQALNNLPRTGAGEKGYISKILKFIGEAQRAEEEEMRGLAALLVQRFSIGGRLHRILRDLRKKN